ncbi:MAG: RNA polymerase sigma factor [Acidimicrobiales bacterium]
MTAVTPRRLYSYRPAAIDLTDEVVRAAKGGDNDAWDIVIRTFETGLKRFMRVRLGNGHDAEDALQQTYFKAVLGAAGQTGENVASFRCWLYRIARNVAIDNFRARARARARLELRADFDDGVDLLAVAVEDGIIAREEGAAARRLLRQLSIEDQEVVALRVDIGLTSEQIGDIIGKKPGTVRQQLKRAFDAIGLRMDP